MAHFHNQFDGRERSSSHDWGEDGSQVPDDCRSTSSQKSDPGYLSSGALSDGTRGEGTHQRPALARNHLRHPLEAAALHVMSGEGRFPTAMSYVSDAQRSDAATVCSGSVMDDIEVESVLSQEDPHHAQLMGASSHHSPVSERDTVLFQRQTRRSIDGDHESLADPPSFSPGFAQEHEALCQDYQRHGLESVNAQILTSQGSDLPRHDMGPPLSRALLLQNEDGLSPFPMADGSNGSDGGMRGQSDGEGSVDIPLRSDEAESTTADMAMRSSSGVSSELRSRTIHSPLSVGAKGPGSDSGGHIDMDDCGGSLDVETHSIGTRSIHSQDDCPVVDSEPTATNSDTQSETPSAAAQLNNLRLSDTLESGGRRSPGASLKGRGLRRFNGRNAYLPLKRFHQNGVHLDTVNEYVASLATTFMNRDREPSSALPFENNSSSAFESVFHDHRGDEAVGWERGLVSADPHHHEARRNGVVRRQRSRSRSRSPSPDLTTTALQGLTADAPDDRTTIIHHDSGELFDERRARLPARRDTLYSRPYSDDAPSRYGPGRSDSVDR